ncbi:MAG: protein kinase, partial [Anaerolineaceae bacterium]|nr:protein kinase [Anaerolineaceae bacterium]
MGNNRCYGCMELLEPGQMICPRCGHDNLVRMNQDMTLPEGNTLLDGKYLIGKVLGIGGFGITYLGLDTKLGLKVAIKEYFPQNLCIRDSGTTEVKISTARDSYKKYHHGMDSFAEEARILAKFSNRGIVHVREFFPQNNTTYIVMDYAEGIGLDEEILRCGGRMDWQRVVSLMLPLMRDLYSVHQKQVIHRDIKPQNIRIVRDEVTGGERLVLLDFGAARNFVSSELSGTFTAILTPGYSPPEQYLQHTHLGPYTDIYSLCGTMYTAICGHKPPAAPDRMYGGVRLKPFSAYGLYVPENVENAIFHGMELNRQDRPQSLFVLYQEISAPAQPVPEWDRIYNIASRLMGSGSGEDLEKAVDLFGQIPGYRDADILAAKCRGDLDRFRENDRIGAEKDLKYVDAKMYMEKGTAESLHAAADLFRQIPGWLDADDLLLKCLDELSLMYAADNTRDSGTYLPGSGDVKKSSPKKQGNFLTILLFLGVCILVFGVFFLNKPQSGENEKLPAIPSETAVPAAEIPMPTDTPVPAAEPTSKPTNTSVPSEEPLPTDTSVPSETPTSPSGYNIGDIITFGRYEQDKKAGSEEIEWQVLDVELGRVLLISKYGLEAMPFHDEYENVTWERSSLRGWLNWSFCNTAFTSDESKRIDWIEHSNPDNEGFRTSGGNNTQDRIFLLSVDELNTYLTDEEMRKCEATYHAQNNGAYVYDNGMSWWWLRSPGSKSTVAMYVSEDGTISHEGTGVTYDLAVVRPA